jgi:hypothetical protein
MKPAGRRSVLLLLLLLPAGCADLPGLLSLRAALNREYPDTPIGVRLTDESLLTVTLADSPLQFAPCERRVAEALRLATFIRDHYHGFSALRLVNIEFTSRDGSDSVAQSAPHFPIRFEPAAIAAGLTSLDSTRAVETCQTLDQLH